jgi:16S rRNA (guanine1516-N2)-methyltransferase
VVILLVTTSYDPPDSVTEEAKAAAAELQGQWVPRGKQSLKRLKMKFADPELLLIERDGTWKWYGQEDIPFFFHPSTALLRIKKLLRGESDTLLEACQVEEGDTVVDCTAGLASDAIVLSYAVGSDGHIFALESEYMLYRIVSQGLQVYQTDIEELNEAMRRVSLRHTHHLDALMNMADRSVDIVYFDPMFRRPIEESSWISPMRNAANAEAVQEKTIQEARRVARKRIVIKEHTDSKEFERLGFHTVKRSYSKIAYGVMEC